MYYKQKCKVINLRNKGITLNKKTKEHSSEMRKNLRNKLNTRKHTRMR